MEDFGTKYKQYIGNTEGAIEFLLKKKCGTAVCALFNQDIGYVDLWYGNEKLGQKKTDNWLLSVYKKNSVPASSSDIETGSSEKGNGTAAPQNANPTQI